MLKRNITITPAFDYILNDKAKAKYGRGGAMIWFEVIGDNGAITLKAFTEWYLPETKKAIPTIGSDNVWANILIVHSKKDISEEKDLILLGHHENCPYTCGDCYYYNPYSCSYEQRLVELMVREGSDKLFERLEEIYQEQLGDK